MTRLKREIKTIELMIDIYSKAYPEEFEGCQRLKEYAVKRIENCPFGEEKPVCKKCTNHCYSPEKRGFVKKVMRYSGPRMIFYSPWLTIHHIIHGIIIKTEKNN
jgi:hypothetical protein